MNASISFKGKPIRVFNHDDTLAYIYVKVPTLTRSHCNMQSFRSHPKYGAYANSDLFPGMLNRIRDAQFPDTVNGKRVLRLDNIPENITVIQGAVLLTIALNV